MGWITMDISLIHEEKGHLEKGEKYNVPKDLEEELIKKGKAHKTKED